LIFGVLTGFATVLVAYWVYADYEKVDYTESQLNNRILELNNRIDRLEEIVDNNFDIVDDRLKKLEEVEEKKS
jgi:hypothetical protein